MIPADLETALRKGLAALGEDPAAHPCHGYLAYIELLRRWNRAYNLTGIREPGRMVSHLVLDSLALLPHLHGSRCLDVGSGAGLPGLILALARPDTRWVLLDSNGKKVRFLAHCTRELQLDNVHVVQARVETWLAPATFATIVSRAFGTLTDFYAAVVRLLAPDGIVLAMKGPRPEDEITAELAARAAIDTIPLRVPGVEGGRSAVRLSPRLNRA
jgi:16S rRNA (guanine527-N7)-methyltransferase